MTTPEHRRRLSHVLRRLQFSVTGDDIADLESLAIDDAIQTILNRDTPYLIADGDLDALATEIDEGPWDALTKWYVGRITEPNAGIHERMVWFWHNHFTSSTEKAHDGLMIRQHKLIRDHALGNFRDFMKAIAVDAAMLRWLDGDGSNGDAPNENFAREMMELFVLGVGNYTEDDIRVVARAMSGWDVEYQTGEVTFDPERHYSRPLRFMGERRRWDLESIIDRLCDHPACPAHVAAQLHWFLVGTQPSPQVLQQLATHFRAADLEIMPLVEAIVALPEFTDGVATRPRTPVEWIAAAMSVFGTDTVPFEAWWLHELGQIPFEPPNVSGWARDNRWVNASQVLMRTSILLEPELSDDIINRVEATPDAVLEHCGLHEVSTTTVDALHEAIDAQTEFNRGLELLLTLALNSPEFAHI